MTRRDYPADGGQFCRAATHRRAGQAGNGYGAKLNSVIATSLGWYTNEGSKNKTQANSCSADRILPLQATPEGS